MEKWSEDVRSKRRFGVQAREPGCSDSRDSLSLAEAGAMLSMDPKISKPALKKLTWRERIVESKKVALFARAGLKVKL